MIVTVIPILTGALETILEGLVKGLKDLEIKERAETTQTTAILRSARILRRVLETWRDLPTENNILVKEYNKINRYKDLVIEVEKYCTLKLPKCQQ